LETKETVLIYFLCLLRRDDTNLIIFATKFASRVGDRVDMKLARSRLARKFSKSLDELLLEIVGYIILLAEENYTALGDWLIVRRVFDEN